MAKTALKNHKVLEHINYELKLKRRTARVTEHQTTTLKLGVKLFEDEQHYLDELAGHIVDLIYGTNTQLHGTEEIGNDKKFELVCDEWTRVSNSIVSEGYIKANDGKKNQVLKVRNGTQQGRWARIEQ